MSARHVDDALLPPGALPRRVGKYAIERLLGEGAMGVVYLGRDEAIGRPVAVKTIRRALLSPQASDMSPLARFRNEAQAAGRLNHPNIVSIYEYGEDAGTLFLAMEYVEGASLVESTSRSVRLPLADVLSLMVQLLDALHSAHEQGVWHRDIKPANLIVTPDGRLKVTDFGIARIDTGDLGQGITVMSAVMGSPGYMAPERYTDAKPDRRVDIFSAGVLLYELLTGAAPFMGNQDAVMAQVLRRQPPAPSTLPIREAPPAPLDAVIARAMAKLPEDRYPSARAMREALMQAMGDVAISRTVSPTTCARLMNLAGVVAAAATAAPQAAQPQAQRAAQPAAPATPATPVVPQSVPAARPPAAPIESAPSLGIASVASMARSVESTLLLDRSGIDDDVEPGSPPAPIPDLMRAVRSHGGARAGHDDAEDTVRHRPANAQPAAAGHRQEPIWQATQYVPQKPFAPTQYIPRPSAGPQDPTPSRPLRPIPPAPQPAPQPRATAPSPAPRSSSPHAPRAGSGVPGAGAASLDAAFLSQLVELLRPVLGAMAELTVRHAARRHNTAAALVEAIVQDAVVDDERGHFEAAARALLAQQPHLAAAAMPAADARPAPPSGALPVLGSTPMRPGDEQAAQNALARLVGPIATLFVRRAAARARSREEFYSTLADLSEGTVERRQVLTALWKSE